VFIKTFVTSSSNSTTWGIIMHFHKDCDLEEWIPLFLYGKTHDVARQNCSNLSISKSTIRRVLPIFFFILYLQKGYNSLHDVVMCQTTLFLQKTSSILDICINCLLHLFKTIIPITKLKVFFPLVFQVISNHANLCVHANSLQ
jgi:hypothetical protein